MSSQLGESPTTKARKSVIYCLNQEQKDKLGYDERYVKNHGDGADGALYVERQCGGCGRVLKYFPLPGTDRLSMCVKCGKATWWKVVGV